MPDKKYYYIPSKNKTEGFTIDCESITKDGKKCYLAHNSHGEEAWLFDDMIEYVIPEKHKKKHIIVSAINLSNLQGFTPNVFALGPKSYMWGRELRSGKSWSMCARPHFPR